MRERVRSFLNLAVEEELTNGGDRRSGDFQSRVTRLKAQGESDSSNYVIARLRRDQATDPKAAALYREVTEEGKSANAAARDIG